MIDEKLKDDADENGFEGERIVYIATCCRCYIPIHSCIEEPTKLSPFGKWLCKKCFEYIKRKMHERYKNEKIPK